MATLKDVAERAGITVTTVSRVLNNRGYISEQTRQKVYQAMRELNYQPNELARSLSRRRTNLIGVIVPSISHPYFAKVISALETHAAAAGYKILLCNSRHQKEKENEYLEMLRSNQVAGIVLCSRTRGIEENLRPGLPVVTFERELSGAYSAVCCDNAEGGRMAAEHLIARGCRHLLHIKGSSDVPMPADRREEAFLTVCREQGIPCRVLDTEETPFYALDDGRAVEDIIRSHRETDGVFASSDIIAAQVIQACARCGIRVPEEMKVVGFDDVHVATLVTPRITTIRQPVDQMCGMAVKCIIGQAENGDGVSRSVFAVSLIVREST